MATIRLSQNLVTAWLTGSNRLVQNQLSAANTHFSGGGANTSVLQIYKGSMPSWGTFTNRTQRSSDLLINFPLAQTVGSYSIIGFVDGRWRVIFGVNNVAVAATASGQATWFLLANNQGANTSLTDRAAAMGTVGAIGSGADLELPSTEIVTGDFYTSAGVYLNFPQSWEF